MGTFPTVSPKLSIEDVPRHVFWRAAERMTRRLSISAIEGRTVPFQPVSSWVTPAPVSR